MLLGVSAVPDVRGVDLVQVDLREPRGDHGGLGPLLRCHLPQPLPEEGPERHRLLGLDELQADLLERGLAAHASVGLRCILPLPPPGVALGLAPIHVVPLVHGNRVLKRQVVPTLLQIHAPHVLGLVPDLQRVESLGGVKVHHLRMLVPRQTEGDPPKVSVQLLLVHHPLADPVQHFQGTCEEQDQVVLRDGHGQRPLRLRRRGGGGPGLVAGAVVQQGAVGQKGVVGGLGVRLRRPLELDLAVEDSGRGHPRQMPRGPLEVPKQMELPPRKSAAARELKEAGVALARGPAVPREEALQGRADGGEEVAPGRRDRDDENSLVRVPKGRNLHSHHGLSAWHPVQRLGRPLLLVPVVHRDLQDLALPRAQEDRAGLRRAPREALVLGVDVTPRNGSHVLAPELRQQPWLLRHGVHVRVLRRARLLIREHREAVHAAAVQVNPRDLVFSGLGELHNLPTLPGAIVVRVVVPHDRARSRADQNAVVRRAGARDLPRDPPLHHLEVEVWSCGANHRVGDVWIGGPSEASHVHGRGRGGCMSRVALRNTTEPPASSNANGGGSRT